MIKFPLSFDLPNPWVNQKFQTQLLGSINFLVGPNGSGKSRFATTLKGQLPNARLLSTDRLNGMEGNGGLRNIIGDHFPQGFAKNQFSSFKTSGLNFGSGLDTLVLLEERLDLRIQVEATLSHLFNRKINLEWDSGNLVAKATLGPSGASYRLDREECHGIKELLVLLTHLYNDEHPYLIIDEPELNLHPQYQSFFMQEVRRIAGDPQLDKTKKIVFLITHSPFMLDFRSVEDVKSLISFDLRHATPRHIFDLGPAETSRLATLVPRLNVHHKQLFFSDNPVFVEGILDAQLVETIQETRGVSITGAGSCVIDAGGCEEVNHYLNLCMAFGKNANFLYDLDSLFNGNLRSCVRADGTLQSFLASAGVGADFVKYCGDLDSRLTVLIDKFLTSTNTPTSLVRLLNFLNELGPRKDWTSAKLAKGRVSMLTAISRFRDDLVTSTSAADIADVEGRLQKICAALQEKNILLLPGGTLERYLPSYAGDHYKIADEGKSAAVIAECQLLANGMKEEVMATRYGALYDLVCLLPTKRDVDVDPVLKDYLSSYIHDLQGAVLNNPAWGLTEIQTFLSRQQQTAKKIFTLDSFQREKNEKFNAVIKIMPMLGQPERQVVVTNQTNAGMRGFTIERP